MKHLSASIEFARLAICVAVAAAVGCGGRTPARPAACTNSAECPPGNECNEAGQCLAAPFDGWVDVDSGSVQPGIDGGPVDSGYQWIDAGPPDSGFDAGPVDSGPEISDAGPPDSGFDAGPVDSGPQISDAGPLDSGFQPIDSGPPDSGVDAGPMDSGSPPIIDAGPPDSGSDAGPPDSGPADSGQVLEETDSGVPDSGPPDVGATDGGPCANSVPGFLACNGLCVNAAIDPLNCGACGNVCVSGQTCSGDGGSCACAAGTLNDVNNCGTCGNACQSGEICDPDAGLCGCPSGVLDDVNNCGTCGNVCRLNEACDPISGTCGCASGVLDDVNNCGTCGNICQFNEACNADAGSCGCPGGALDDVNNCGACGNACLSGERCMAGACTCPSGMLGDVNNCGTCGTVCGAPANAAPQCSGGSCSFLCNSNFSDCSGVCINLSADPKNCGGCGDACSTTNVVAACSTPLPGTCDGTCAEGFADCNSDLRDDGCETNIVTGDGLTGSSIANCGACGTSCPATANVATGTNAAITCAISACALAKGTAGCLLGFSNCDGTYADGCEIDTNTDTDNCGACGVVCVNGQVCDGNGVCACPPGDSTTNGICCPTGATSCPGTSIYLTVTANPNSVLSAIATLTWTGTIASGSLTFTGGPLTIDVSSESPVKFPVLGLAASTTYSFQANALDAAGNAFQSDAVPLTTGPLPGGMDFMTVTGTPSGSGLTLIANVRSDYATIFDSSGQLAWYYYTGAGNFVIGDFQQQPDGTFTVSTLPTGGHSLPFGQEAGEYKQVDVLGNVLRIWTALGPDGTGKIIDTSGNAVQVVATDIHDIRIQPDGSALLFGFVVSIPPTPDGGTASTARIYSDLLESVAPNGTVNWAWNSGDYFTPAEDDPYAGSDFGVDVDLTHGNAIDVVQGGPYDGDIVMSFRDLSQVVLLDPTTWNIVWKLGGPGNFSSCSNEPCGDFTFVDDPLGGFSVQHGVRVLRPDVNGCITQCADGSAACSNLCGNIILFDDGTAHDPARSRAVEYTLDTTAMTATMVWSTVPSSTLYTVYLGYAQRFANGNTLVSFGTSDIAQELDPTGATSLWDIANASGTATDGWYRAYRIGSLYSYSPPP